jgi:molybdopterin converting factor small subunit
MDPATMHLSIEYWNQARSVARCDGEVVEVPAGTTPTVLVQLLAGRHDGRLRTLLLNDVGQARPSTMLSINGDLAPCRVERPLKDGDVVALLLPIAGG